MRSAPVFTYRRLLVEDLPLLLEWLSQPSVARWWTVPEDAEAELLADDATSRSVAELDGRPVGLVRGYRRADSQGRAGRGAEPGEVGID